jgi:hypothetical protein
VDTISRWKNVPVENADDNLVDLFQLMKILIQLDKVLLYNYRLLLVCYKQYKNSVEIEFKNTTCIA